MVSLLSLTSGNVLVSAIVPVTLKLIVSLPLPALQPLTRVWLFAAVIASREAQIPDIPGSASELTVIVAAPAAVLSATARGDCHGRYQQRAHPEQGPRCSDSAPLHSSC